MTDDLDNDEMWGTSTAAETVGVPKPGFFKTNQTIIVSSLVLLVLSGAAVNLLLQGLQKPDEKPPANNANEARQANHLPDEKSNVADIVKKTTEIFPAMAPNDLWESKEKAAVNRAAIIELQNHTQALKDSYRGLTELQTSMKNRLELLQHNQEGARLTANADLVAQYFAVANKFEELTRYDLGAASFLSSIEGLMSGVVEANAAEVFHPQNETIEQAKQFDKSVRERTTELSELAAGLDSLLKPTQKNPPGITLAVAISNAEKEQADSLAKRIASISERARAQSLKAIEKRIMAAEEDFVKSETELKVAKLRGEASQNRQQAAEIDAKAKQAEIDRAAAIAKQKLESEFTASNSEIRTYLSSLMADGRTNRGAETGVGPVSYTAVLSSGALENSNDGIITMSKWCGSNGLGWSGLNPRAKDSKVIILSDFMITQPKYEPSVRFSEKAQQLLRKFGPLMVEKGLLAK